MDITAIYPGTFDPVTLGHIDVAGRAAKMFDQLIIAVAASPGKKPHFDLAQRCDMAEHVLSAYPNVRLKRLAVCSSISQKRIKRQLLFVV